MVSPNDSLRPLFDAVEAQDMRAAAAKLRDLPQTTTQQMPADWLDRNAFALERGDFDLLSEGFANVTFGGPEGYFLIVAPYTLGRATGDVCKLSALFGRIVPFEPTPGIAEVVEDIQGAKLRDPLKPIQPIEILAKTSGLGPSQFIPPDGWGWRDSVAGRALLDFRTDKQTRDPNDFWHGNPVTEAFNRIFDEETAHCLLEAIDDDRTSDRYLHSFEFHEAGHAAGVGMFQKVRDNLLPGYWYRGVEEWRADGMCFEIAARLLSPEDAILDSAGHFCLRLGTNLSQAAGPDVPNQHTPCSLLMLDRLLREEHLIVRNGRLALRDPTPMGRFRALEPQRRETVELTRREVAAANPHSVMRLFGTTELHPSTIAVFEGMIRAPILAARAERRAG